MLKIVAAQILAEVISAAPHIPAGPYVEHPAWVETWKPPTLAEAMKPYAIAYGLDMASTEFLRARYGSHFRESDPLPGMQTTPGQLAWAAVRVYGRARGDIALQKLGYRKLARGIRWGTIGYQGLFVVLNVIHGIGGKQSPQNHLAAQPYRPLQWHGPALQCVGQCAR